MKITPWRLVDIPFPVVLPTHTGNWTASRIRIDTNVLTPRQRAVLEASSLLHSDMEEWTVSGLLEALYVNGGGETPWSDEDRARLKIIGYGAPLHVAAVGYPLSFDPQHRTLLCGYPLESRILSAVEQDEMARDFLALDLTYRGSGTDEDREAICRFCAKYGLFIPFHPLTPGTVIFETDVPSAVQTMPPAPDDLSDIIGDSFMEQAALELLMRKPVKTYPEPTVPHIVDSGIADEHGNAIRLADLLKYTMNPDSAITYEDYSTDRGPYSPYHGGANPELWTYRTKWMCFYEAFRVWHEAATELQSMSPNEIDYTEREENGMSMHQRLLGRLWKSCATTSISAEAVARNGKYNQFRIYSTETAIQSVHPCVAVLTALQKRLRAKFEEDTEGKNVKLRCMTPECTNYLTAGRSNKYKWSQEVNETWIYCRSCQSGPGRDALLKIADLHPEHKALAQWASNYRGKDNERQFKTPSTARDHQPSTPHPSVSP